MKVPRFRIAPATCLNVPALDVGGDVDSRFGDIRDDRSLDDVLAAARPDVVFHLAAQATVRRAYAEPALTFDVNVMGTVRLLEAIRRCATVSAVVAVTSDKCYAEMPQALGRPYVEGDALGGLEPYGASKACAEIVVAAYREALFADTGVRLATARAGNVIGGGDWTPDRLVTDLVRALKAGRSLDLRYPMATRPWQHVLEPLCGYLVLAERLVQGRGDYSEAWNFGPRAEDVTTVAEFVARFETAWGARASRDAEQSYAPPEALHLLLDSSHAAYELGWRCRLSLQTAIEWTVDWYKSPDCARDARAITGEQLQRYLSIPEISLPTTTPSNVNRTAEPIALRI